MLAKRYKDTSCEWHKSCKYESVKSAMQICSWFAVYRYRESDPSETEILDNHDLGIVNYRKRERVPTCANKSAMVS